MDKMKRLTQRLPKSKPSAFSPHIRQTRQAPIEQFAVGSVIRTKQEPYLKEDQTSFTLSGISSVRFDSDDCPFFTQSNQNCMKSYMDKQYSLSFIQSFESDSKFKIQQSYDTLEETQCDYYTTETEKSAKSKQMCFELWQTVEESFIPSSKMKKKQAALTQKSSQTQPLKRSNKNQIFHAIQLAILPTVEDDDLIDNHKQRVKRGANRSAKKQISESQLRTRLKASICQKYTTNFNKYPKRTDLNLSSSSDQVDSSSFQESQDSFNSSNEKKLESNKGSRRNSTIQKRNGPQTLNQKKKTCADFSGKQSKKSIKNDKQISKKLKGQSQLRVQKAGLLRNCRCCGKLIEKLCFKCPHIYCNADSCKRNKKKSLNNRMLEKMKQEKIKEHYRQRQIYERQKRNQKVQNTRKVKRKSKIDSSESQESQDIENGAKREQKAQIQAHIQPSEQESEKEGSGELFFEDDQLGEGF